MVFVEKNRGGIEEVEVLKQTMTNLNQYYIEYDSLDNLSNLLSEELTKYISEHKELLVPKNGHDEAWKHETPRECARHAFLLGRDMLSYLCAYVMQKDEKETLKMISLMRGHMEFWNIDYSGVPNNEYGFPSPDSIRHELEMNNSISKEYWNIMMFVYNYLLLCLISVHGGLDQAGKIMNDCKQLYHYTNLPENILDEFPKTPAEFDEYVHRLMHYYCNCYIDNVMTCKCCGQRVVAWRNKCSCCGKILD